MMETFTASTTYTPTPNTTTYIANAYKLRTLSILGSSIIFIIPLGTNNHKNMQM